MKRTIKELDLNNKKVIIRVDFNVPIKDGKITDDNRIVESLPTINYAIEKGAKIVLMSHLGRIKTEEDKIKNTLKPVSEHLSKLLNKEVIFINETRGTKLEEAISNLKQGDVLLMENTRYEDLDGEKESKNDLELGQYWASLGDVFINDAFGTSHRAHASNVGIASNLENAVGLLIEKELEIMGTAIKEPKRPLVVIMGGSKVEDKINLLENLVNVADKILIGGAMAYTFLKAEGYEIGHSLLDEKSISFCQSILEKNPTKIILPVDTVVAKDPNSSSTIVDIDEIPFDQIGLDIGNKTIEIFKKELQNAKTIIWNGPVGMFEAKNFSHGTKELCDILSKLDNIKIIGGGDTGSAIINMGYKDAMTHISTGGGASLELLEGKDLPGISIIKER